LKEGLDGCCDALDVAREAAVDAGPGEGALNHPALGLYETGVGALDDLKWLRRCGSGAWSLVTRIREDAFDERKAPDDAVEERAIVAPASLGRAVVVPIRRRLSKGRQFRVTPEAARRWREIRPEGIDGVCIVDDELGDALGLPTLIAMRRAFTASANQPPHASLPRTGRT
jgi:hypothetical protein